MTIARSLAAVCVPLSMCLVTETRAVVIRHDRTEADALQLGARFEAAGAVLPDGGCALIGATWALTAAHVAAGLATGGTVRFADRNYGVKRTLIHPEGARRADAPPEVDLALLELSTAVVGIAPLELYRDRDELGQVLFIVGTGDFARAGTPWVRADGRRRAVTNRVDEAGPRRLFLRFDMGEAATEFEGIGGPGDSGGPAVLERSGKRFVAGISSGSMGKPGQYGATDVYTRVSSYIEWVETSMRASPSARPSSAR